jgi:hypothetical protein
MKYKLQSGILLLPTETIENICFLVDKPNDLQSLTHVSRFFASIACPVYATRLGIRVTDASRFVQIQGNSFRALAAWRRSRLFSCLQDKYLACDINDEDLELAYSQIRALRNFLSASFIGRPFIAVYITSADSLSPSEILQFIRLIDGAGCLTASISSGLGNPQWFDYSSSHTRTMKLPTTSLSHLSSLDVDNQYLSPHQWSFLLSHLAGPLETLSIRGQPTIHALSKFLSRHPNVRKLHFYPRWAAHNRCISPSGCPQKIQMLQLSEIEGPPCHLRALLRCLSPAPVALTIKMGCDLAMTYKQYVRNAFRSVSLCGPRVHLEIRLTSYYDRDYMVLEQSEIKSLRTITLPEVASLEIAFPSMSEGRLLVRSHLLGKYKLI